MIDGADNERGSVTAGGRGYYLKVCILAQLSLLSLKKKTTMAKQ